MHIKLSQSRERKREREVDLYYIWLIRRELFFVHISSECEQIELASYHEAHAIWLGVVDRDC